MKFIRYSKYTGEPADDVDLQELLKRLGDFFLQSGGNLTGTIAQADQNADANNTSYLAAGTYSATDDLIQDANPSKGATKT